MDKYEIMRGIQHAFPKFQSKSSIVEYYCNYDIPRKQSNLLKFWTDVLKFVNAYSELNDIFEVYGLKPLPIKNILKALGEDNQVYSLTDYKVLYGPKTQQLPEKGVLGKVWGYFKPPSKQLRLLEDRVFFKSIVDKALADSLPALRSIFIQSLVLEEEVVVELLKGALKLNQDVDLVIKILELQNKISKAEVQTSNRVYIILIYLKDGKDNNQQTIQIEKVRFGLKVKVEEFNKKIQALYLGIQNLTSKAREFVEKGDKTLSLTLLKEKVTQQRHLAGLVSRRRVLTNSLNQMDESQFNQSVAESIQASQKLLKSNTMEEGMMQQIKMNMEEIQFNLDQAEKIYKQVAGNNSEMEDLFKQLEMETLREQEALRNAPPSKKQELYPQTIPHNPYNLYPTGVDSNHRRMETQ